MKELLIITQFYYPKTEATGRLLTELAEDLVDLGMGVSVLTGKEGRSALPDKETINGVDVYRASFYAGDKNKKINRLLSYVSLMLSWAFKIRLLKNHQKILVVTNPPLAPIFGWLAKDLFGKKFIYLVHDVYPDIAVPLKKAKKESVGYKVMDWLQHKFVARADRIIVLGDDMNDLYVRKGATEKQLAVIRNWEDANEITVKDKLNQFSQKHALTDKFAVMFTGNISLFQNLEILIEAAKRLQEDKDIVFVIIGEGANKQNIISQAKAAGLDNVIFLPYLSNEDYNDALASADCHFVSLYKGTEGLCVSSKSYSYLAAGRPLLVWTQPGSEIFEMVRNNDCGEVVGSERVEDLVDKIIYLRNNPDVRSRYSQNARKLFEDKFERKIITKQYFDLIKSI